jgi:hypothetical protein
MAPSPCNGASPGDRRLRNPIAAGTAVTGPQRDYTVKVDASGLEPGAPTTTDSAARAWTRRSAAPARCRRRSGRAAVCIRVMLELSVRLLQCVPPHRGAARPRLRAAPGRLHLRVSARRLRQPGTGRATRRRADARNRHARRLPVAPRAVQDRCRPAGAASAAPDDLCLGRPRERQRCLARRRGESQPRAGRRRMERAARCRGACLPRVPADPHVAEWSSSRSTASSSSATWPTW